MMNGKVFVYGNIFLKQLISFHLYLFLTERQIKVQFCADPLSQVIHYETDEW